MWVWLTCGCLREFKFSHFQYAVALISKYYELLEKYQMQGVFLSSFFLEDIM